MSGKSCEIVIGVDFGTTHSGVSWAVNAGSKRIRVINDWPDPSASTVSKEKVPSTISYANGKPQKWGYAVDLTDLSFCWIKILLEENHKYATMVEPVKNSNTLLREVHKTAQEVVADYLKLLWEYTIDDIRKHYPNYKDIYSLRVVLTVPAIWSPAAKDKTLDAAKLAGMPGKIELVTEPEAAALATLKEKADENQLQVGDAFVVCDAGGGTVDLISYKVERLNPLRIKECAIGSGSEGGLCGSVFLDVAFAKYIETVVGKGQYNRIKESSRKKMMKEFEFGVKRTFNGQDDRKHSVDLKGVKDDPENHIVDDTITINSYALAAIFDPVMQQIQQLVADQIADVAENGLTVKAVLLVGGFGANQYLYKRLRTCHESNGILVMQVNGAWSSICRGATHWGLEHINPALSSTTTSSPTVSCRLSRYSYGVAIDQAYDSSEHNIQDRYLHKITGTYRARNQMTWFLKRGEEVEERKILSIPCSYFIEVDSSYSGMLEITNNLYYCENFNSPTRKTKDVQSLCTVKYQVPWDNLKLEKSYESEITKIRYYKPEVSLRIMLENVGLAFLIFHRDEFVAQGEAKYPETFV